MSEHSQNNPGNPNNPKTGASPATRKLSCEEWEALLVDFLDGTLPPAEREIFHSHEQTCSSCAEMFSQASQGRDWLNFLRVEPVVPAALVSRIVAQTSGSLSSGLLPQVQPGGELVPASGASLSGGAALPFWRRIGAGHMPQPRLMMTTAMAFFSITLTLNMAGVRLGAVRLADLRPASLSSNLDKQYHMASARVVRYYDNLRFVYEMEARVRELRRDADLSTPPAGEETPARTPAPQNDNHKSGGKSEGPSATQPPARLWGEQVQATLRFPFRASLKSSKSAQSAAKLPWAADDEDLQDRTAGQAERGLA